MPWLAAQQYAPKGKASLASNNELRRFTKRPAIAGRSRMFGVVLLAALAALLLLAQLAGRPEPQATGSTPRFLMEELGSPHTSAQLVRKPAPGLTLSVKDASFGLATELASVSLGTSGSGEWQRHESGATRPTAFGSETITFADESVEHYLTVEEHQGRRTWTWPIKASVKARLLDNGGVGFVDPKSHRVLDIELGKAQVFDSSRKDVTPKGARWSLVKRGGAVLLALDLNDASLPLPYTIDPIAFRASAAVQNGAGSTSIAVTIPAAVQDGDLLLARVALRSGTATVSDPSGQWTTLVNTAITLAPGLTLQTYRKRATDADGNGSTSYTFNLSASVPATAGITAWAGVDTNVAVGAVASTVTSNSTQASFPAVTAQSLRIGFGAHASTNTWPGTCSITCTLRGSMVNASGVGSGVYETGAAFGAFTVTTGAPSTSSRRAGHSIAVTTDATAPSASVITFPAAAGEYNNTTFNAGCATNGFCGTATDTGSGILQVQVSIRQGAGNYWNGASFASAAEVFQTATITGGTNWALTFASTNFPAEGNYTVRVVATDNGGNANSGTSATFLIDRTVPLSGVLTLNSVTPAGRAFLSGSTVWYRGVETGGGNFRIRDTVTDNVGGSGPGGSQTNALGGTTTGWTHTTSTVSTPVGGPFDSNTFTWVQNTISSPTEVVNALDQAGNSLVLPTLTFSDDSATNAPVVTFPVASASYNNAGWNAGCSTVPGDLCGTAGDSLKSGIALVDVSIQQGAGNYWNGASFASATEVFTAATGTAAWSLGFVAANFPANGTYNFRVRATDNVGNTAITTLAVTIDNTAPTAPTGLASVPVSPANNNDPRITGSAEALSTVSLYATATCTGGIVASGTAAAFASPGLNPVDIADNSTTSYSATATDAAGNVSACSSALSYVEDSTAPAAPSALASVPVSPANNNDPRITGTAEALSTVSLYATATCTGGIVASGTAAAFASPGLNPADIADNSTTSYSATTTDQAGNVSACSSALSYLEDSTNPASVVTFPTAGGTYRTATWNNPAGTASDTGGAGLLRVELSIQRVSTTLYWNGAAFADAVENWRTATGTAAWSLTFPAANFPADGNYTLRVRAIDNANNTQAATSYTVTIDNAAPAAPTALASVPVSPANNNDPRFTGTAEALSTVSLYATATCTGGIVASGTAAAFASPGLNPADIADNSTTSYSATATDQAGNVSACSSAISYVEDSTAPAAPTALASVPVSPANNNDPRFTGTAEALSTVSLYATATCTGGIVASGTAAAFASPGLNPADIADNSTTSYSATATDVAGNVSACSSALSYVEDSAAPAAPSALASVPVSPANNNDPRLTGTAEALSTVSLYATATCTGGIVASGTAAAFAGPGLNPADIADNSTTSYSATATDQPATSPPARARSATSRTPPPRPPPALWAARPSRRRTTTTPGSPAPPRRSRPSRSTRPPPAPGASSAAAPPPLRRRRAEPRRHRRQQHHLLLRHRDRRSRQRLRLLERDQLRRGLRRARPPPAPWPARPSRRQTTTTPGSPAPPKPSRPSRSTRPRPAPAASSPAAPPPPSPGAGLNPADIADNSTTSYSATATDQAGNISACSSAISYLEDSTNPASVVTFPTAGGTYRTATWNNPTGTASDAGGAGLLRVEVSIQRVSTTLYWNGSAFADAVENWRNATGTAAWSLTFPAANFPADGNYTLRVRAIDNASNTQTATSYTVTIDNAAPNTSITAQPSDPTNSIAPSFSFTSSEGGSTFECQLDGGGYSSCTCPKSYAGQTQGSHTFQVRATDVAGNLDASPASYTWTIDTTEPTSAIAFPAAAGIYRTATLERLLGHRLRHRRRGARERPDLDPARLQQPLLERKAFADAVENWRTATGTASWSLTFPAANFPADGNYTIRVRATDTATNLQSTPVSRTFTIDTAAPNTSITAQPSDPTNSIAPSFSFTSSEGGSTFECQLDGGGYSSCTSPKSYTGQTQGSHTFQVRATDTAGNTDATPASFTWTIDTTAPSSTISFPAAAGIYRTATWNDFSGSASDTGGAALANVQISIQRVSSSLYWNGSAFADAVENWRPATGTASWSLAFAVSNFPADGDYMIRVRATDTATNVQTPISRTFEVDTAAPNTSITAQPNDPTNSTAPSFSFTSSEGGSTFECQLDGGGYSSCTSPKSYTGQTQGSHTFLVRATDPAGNVDATPASFTWTIDTTEPTSAISFPAAAGIYRTATWNDFSGTAADTGGAALANVQISIQRVSTSLYWNGIGLRRRRPRTGAPPPAPHPGRSRSPSRTSPPTATTRSVSARPTPRPTCRRTPVSRTFTIDTTAPNTTISAQPNDPTNSTAPSFSFTSSEGGSTFECQLDGGGYTSCTSPKSYTGQTQGSHTFLVRATDPAGNVDASPASYTWTIDTTTPSTVVSFPSSGGFYSATGWANVTGTASDAGGATLDKVEVSVRRVSSGLYWNGTAFADGSETWHTATGTASWSLAFASTNFPADGDYVVRARAADTATNVEAAGSYSVTYDDTAPNTSITAQPSDPTNSTAPSFSFTSSEGGSTFACQLDGGGYSSCTSPKSYTGQTQGSHTFQVRATDTAGNTDATPASFTWTIDTTAPSSTISFPAAAGIYRTATWNDFSGSASDTGGAALANVQISIQRVSSSSTGTEAPSPTRSRTGGRRREPHPGRSRSPSRTSPPTATTRSVSARPTRPRTSRRRSAGRSRSTRPRRTRRSRRSRTTRPTRPPRASPSPRARAARPSSANSTAAATPPAPARRATPARPRAHTPSWCAPPTPPATSTRRPRASPGRSTRPSRPARSPSPQPPGSTAPQPGTTSRAPRPTPAAQPSPTSRSRSSASPAASTGTAPTSPTGPRTGAPQPAQLPGRSRSRPPTSPPTVTTPSASARPTPRPTCRPRPSRAPSRSTRPRRTPRSARSRTTRPTRPPPPSPSPPARAARPSSANSTAAATRPAPAPRATPARPRAHTPSWCAPPTPPATSTPPPRATPGRSTRPTRAPP